MEKNVTPSSNPMKNSYWFSFSLEWRTPKIAWQSLYIAEIQVQIIFDHKAVYKLKFWITNRVDTVNWLP